MAHFQTFADTASPTQGVERIAKLRKELQRRGFSAFVVPRADEHQSEYVAANAERLAWLTGFTGSAGTAVILLEKAALVVDGRYTFQAEQQVDPRVITPIKLAEMTSEEWIATNLPADGILAYDPWLHTAESAKRLEKAVERAGGSLAPIDINLVDVIWVDRPPAPHAPIHEHLLAFAGESATSKLERIRESLTKAKVDALVISDPHNLAWAFNIRGGDVSHTPLAFGYALMPKEGRAQLFLDPAKVTNESVNAIADLADLRPPQDFMNALKNLSESKTIRLDQATAAMALSQRIDEAGGKVDLGPDPITLMKAVKNETEIAGTRAAHRRDGVAMVQFLKWLDDEAPKGNLNEIGVVEALEEFRIQTGVLKDISFPSISGAGPNAAIPHYRVTEGSNRPLERNQIFLIDSGAQYEDGTTDITRTVIIGTPSGEMKDRYTRVLKGHIAIACAVFPKGTSGAQIDVLARQFLWEVGLDFDHGTGHGIGSYLSVHEGPQRLSKLGHTTLEAGMLLSNEPGFYKHGEYGIRIENIVLVAPREIKGAEREMLGFDTITLAPIDKRLIDTSLLTASERTWLDAYHARVRENLEGDLAHDDAVWLRQATQPIG